MAGAISSEELAQRFAITPTQYVVLPKADGTDDGDRLFGTGGLATNAMSAGLELVLMKGKYHFTGNQTAPSGLLMRWQQGVELNVSSTKTLTVLSFVDGKGYTFSGDGTVDMTAAQVPPGSNELAPIAGDNGETITDAVAAGKGAELIAGTFPISTTITMLSKQKLTGTPDSLISSTVDPDGGFYANHVSSTPAAIAAGTLHTTAVVGASTIAVDISPKPAAGQGISVIYQDSSFTRTVVSASGSSTPYTVTLNRPVPIAATSADSVVELHSSVPRDIKIEGVRFTGTGNVSVLITNTDFPVLRDVSLVATAGLPDNAAFDFDGCYGGLMERVRSDMTGTSNAPGPHFQSCENSLIRECEANGGSYGVLLSDCIQSGMESCWAYNCTSAGFLLISLNAAGVNFGCQDPWITGGGAIACADGLGISGTQRGLITNFSARACTAHGILMSIVTGLTTADNRFINCSTPDCVQGFYIDSSSVTGTYAQNLNVSGCTSYGVHTKGDVVIDGLIAKGMGGSSVAVFNETGRMTINDIQLVTTSSAGSGASAVTSTGTSLDMVGGTITVSGSATIPIQCSGVMNLKALNISLATGIGVQFTGTKATMRDLVIAATGSNAYCVQATAGTVEIDGVKATSADGHGFIFSAGTTVYMNGCSVTADDDKVPVDTSADLLVMTNCTITAGANSAAVNVNAGRAIFRDCHFVGPASSYGVQVFMGAKARFYNCTFTGGIVAGNEVNNAGTVNFGTLTLNGASDVTVTFADLLPNEKPNLENKTLGGTPAPYKIKTLTPGTSFVVTGTAGDTSDVYWWV